VALGVACNPGTSSHDVFLTNGTAGRLVVYELIRQPGLSRTIEPGVTTKSSWPYPVGAADQRKARVEADDASGTLVYCREFSWDELNSLSWKIVISGATMTCSPK
jgi:hypothetical protein